MSSDIVDNKPGRVIKEKKKEAVCWLERRDTRSPTSSDQDLDKIWTSYGKGRAGAARQAAGVH